jgi:hypothetical protein
VFKQIDPQNHWKNEGPEDATAAFALGRRPAIGTTYVRVQVVHPLIREQPFPGKKETRVTEAPGASVLKINLPEQSQY